MFTVMQQDDGCERFFTAFNVEYRGPHVQASPSECVVLKQEDGVEQIIPQGRVYVMNAEGATVGRYILPMSAHPATGVAFAA